jgi:hypothetical protein
LGAGWIVLQVTFVEFGRTGNVARQVRQITCRLLLSGACLAQRVQVFQQREIAVGIGYSLLVNEAGLRQAFTWR